MRTIYGILIVSALLFIGSVAFVVVGIRNAAAPAASSPVATVKQIMRGIVVPASNVVYNAVATTVTKEGTQETVPRTDRDWENVGSNAVALVEAANLLKVGGRAKDRSDWPRMADAMAKAAMQAYRATEAKNAEALLAAGEVLNSSCESCHRNYDVLVE